MKKNNVKKTKAELGSENSANDFSENSTDALIARQNIIEESNTATTRQLEPIIIGAGGFAREVWTEVKKHYGNEMKMYVDDQYWVEGLYKISEFNSESQSALIAVGSPDLKKELLSKLPENTTFWNYISPRAYIGDLKIGTGNFICAGVIITTNVVIGNHVHLNLQTTVGHDSVIGDLTTTAPSVNISGNVNIGKSVYLGTQCCIREKILICDGVTIGMNATVISDITESGIYIGTPASKIK